MERVRYRLMDTIKGLACLAVILIHFNFPDFMGEIVKPMCRFAVPYFFFVSGFFCANSNNMLVRSNTCRKIKHIVRLLVTAAIFYAVFCIIWNNLIDPDWNILDYSRSLLTKDKITKLLITCDPLVYSHLWFLMALVYCYFTVLPFQNTKTPRWFTPVSLILLTGFFIFGELKYLVPVPSSIPLYDTENRLYLFNLYLFRALPFFLIGMVMKLYAEKIKKIFSGIAPVYFYIVIALGMGLAVVESMKIGIVQFYVGNYIALGSMFLLSITYPQMHNSVLEFIGQKLSLYIYIFHIMIGNLVNLAANKIKIYNGESVYSLSSNPIWRYCRPLVILTLCLAITFIIRVIEEKTRRYKNIKNK